MPRLGKRYRVLHGLTISNFAYRYHVRGLSQCIFQSAVPISDINAHLPLVNYRFLVLMHKLDRILNRDNVAACMTVTVVNHGGQ